MAAPVRYVLVSDKSHVGFKFKLNGITQNGSMPVERADILIDAQNLAASRIDVTVAAARARTGLIFVTQAMTGPDVLNTAQFPTIRFVSRRITLGTLDRISEGAAVTGDLTLRGVTRSVTLQAALYRQPGSAADDLSQLDVVLSSTLNRNDFGASGFPNLVADTVTLDIRARINAVK
ncbi:YceI family protein [Parasedimentitalea marina]|uniref:YceI family protein n=1 Tax=Parasedimentitalea marina TaxID=2483033 RepID=UPI0030842C57